MFFKGNHQFIITHRLKKLDIKSIPSTHIHHYYTLLTFLCTFKTVLLFCTTTCSCCNLLISRLILSLLLLKRVICSKILSMLTGHHGHTPEWNHRCIFKTVIFFSCTTACSCCNLLISHLILSLLLLKRVICSEILSMLTGYHGHTPEWNHKCLSECHIELSPRINGTSRPRIWIHHTTYHWAPGTCSPFQQLFQMFFLGILQFSIKSLVRCLFSKSNSMLESSFPMM